MTVPRVIVAAALLAPLAFAGCGGSTAAALCAPEAVQSCTCDGGEAGLHTCNAAGSDYTQCECVSAPESDTSTPGPDVANPELDVTSPVPDIAAPDASTQDVWGDVDATPGDDAPPDDEPMGPGVIVPEPDDEAAYIYDQSEVRTYAITIEPTNLAFLDSNPKAEEYVPATLEFEGETYPVGMRYKGSVGAFLSPCVTNSGAKNGKCSTKLSFTWGGNSGERFFGMKRLNFHHMQRDASHMRDRLGYNLFREFGAAASRVVHVRLMVNGELEGLFALVEQVDGRFTRSRFTEGGKGNLYKEIWPIHDDEQAYIDALQTNKDDSPSVFGMQMFKAAIALSTEAMEGWLDRQMMIRYLAADRVMINDDGIFHWWCAAGGQGNNPGPNGNHNYYWYQAAESPRFWLIPWDMDNSFNTGQNSAVHVEPEWSQPGNCNCGFGGGQRAPSCDPMISRWSTDWMADYELAVDAFLAGPFSEDNVNAKLDAWEAQITPLVEETGGVNGAVTFSQWQNGLATLRSMIDSARTNRGYAY